MIEFADYFQPLENTKRGIEDRYTLTEVINAYMEDGGFPDLEGVNIAIIGVEEDRGAINNSGTSVAPDYIRRKLYQLKNYNFRAKIVDLGNIKKGFELTDTYFALSMVCSELMKLNIIPVIIGGSHDLTYAQYCAYERLEQTVNIVAVDSNFDLFPDEESINSRSYLSRIILHQPSYLFNYSNVGYQTYFEGSESVAFMDKLYFDAYRLGAVRTKIEEMEPVIRSADMVTFDISSVRQSDAPGNKNASPNGFYGEEACQIIRYAGLSDKLSSIGFYEVNPSRDNFDQTSHLVAQMIWYFIEGYCNRKNEFPVNNKNGFIKYRVPIKDIENEIVFYKSKKSERWWMEVPFMDAKVKYERHHIVPCSYDDYQVACNEEIPERWWQAFKKLS